MTNTEFPKQRVHWDPGKIYRQGPTTLHCAVILYRYPLTLSSHHLLWSFTRFLSTCRCARHPG